MEDGVDFLNEQLAIVRSGEGPMPGKSLQSKEAENRRERKLHENGQRGTAEGEAETNIENAAEPSKSSSSSASGDSGQEEAGSEEGSNNEAVTGAKVDGDEGNAGGEGETGEGVGDGDSERDDKEQGGEREKSRSSRDKGSIGSKRSRSRGRGNRDAEKRRRRSHSGGRREKDRERDRSSRKDRHRDRDDRERRSSRRSRSRDRERDSGRRSRRNDMERDDRRDRDRGRYSSRRDRDRTADREADAPRSRRRSSVSASRSLSPRRSEKSLEEREEAAKRAAISELTRDQRTVFVNQLTMKVTENDLARYFGLLGEVNNVIMLRDKFTNRHKGGDSAMTRGLPRHKGFAYVEMKSLEAVPVVLQLNDRVPDFQKFPVMVKASEAEKNYLAKQEEKAKNPNGQQKAILGNAAAMAGLKLHIGNLHQNITEDDLSEICRSFGEVTQLILHRDEAGESKRFAFVTYAEKECATACLEKLEGLEVAGKALSVSLCQVSHGKSDPNATANTNDATGNWKLDDDEGTGGLKMDSANRATLMARLGAPGTPGAAAQTSGGFPVVPTSSSAAVSTAAATAQAHAAAAALGLSTMSGFPNLASGNQGVMQGLPGYGLPGASVAEGPPAQSPSAAANAALEAALSGTAYGTNGAIGAQSAMGVGGQAPSQVTGQGPLHPALAASLPGMAALGGAAGQGMAPVPAPAPAAPAKPPILGNPTFCLLVKNMFDPLTETEEGWELDIKEEMEEECSKHGTVMHSYVESRQPGGLVYVMFSTSGAAVASAEMLNGRWFAGRMVQVEYLNPQVYTTKFPEATKAAQTALATAANA